MKAFKELIDETMEIEDLEELEAAADLFQFGLEKGYYKKGQVDEFNNVYWEVKNKFLAQGIWDNIKGNKLDIISIVSKAPTDIKDDKDKLYEYVIGRLKALKGKGFNS